MIAKITRLLLLIFLPLTVTFSQETSLSFPEEEIEALVRRDVPEGAPGVAFGMVQDGKIIYTRYAGFANLDSELEIGPDTRFNIASNGKQFTALAILTLVEQGDIRLDDDIRKFFPLLLPEVTDEILIEHLLTHTSGIRDVYGLLSLQNITWWKKTLNNQDVIQLLEKQRALNFQPGTAYLYSNSNYILLAEIIAQVTGRPFTEYLNELFTQLGMPDTAFEADHTQIKEPIARPYFNFNTWTSYDWIWDAVGDGNLFTTLPDQLRWEQIVQTKKSDILSQETIEQSQQSILPTYDYGYGLEFSRYKGYPVVFHHGATGAWKATFMRFPEQQVSLITLSNSGKTIVSDQNQKIADVILGLSSSETTAFPIGPEKTGDFISQEQVAGIYRDDSGTTFEFLDKAGELYLARFGRNDIKLTRESDNVFQQSNDPAFKQEFKKNDAGQWTVTAYYPTHAPYTLTKVTADFSQFDPNCLNGNYFNVETGVSVSIQSTGQRTYEVVAGEDKMEGKLLTPASMMVNNYTLNWGENGGIYLDGGRIRKVYFAKVE